MKYRFMDLHGSGFEVKKMVQVLGVHRSGYYGYQKHRTSPRVKENEKLGELIHQVATKSEAHLKIYDFIEIYYNRERRHSALNYQTPIEYANAVIQP